MDMLGLDFIGPFRPVAVSGACYIIITVDYTMRFLWAKAVPTAMSVNVLEFIKKCIVHPFRYPQAIYTDNGSHFTGGVFPQTMETMSVKIFRALIRHPQSVGLAERYVQIVLAGLRAVLQDSPEFILMWDFFLDNVVHAANTRVIRTFRYTLSQLLLGFNLKYFKDPPSVNEHVRITAIAEQAEENEE